MKLSSCLFTVFLTAAVTFSTWSVSVVAGKKTAFEKFVNSIEGDVIVRNDSDATYNEERLGSLLHNFIPLFPSLIVLCQTQTDVKKTVNYALETGQSFVVRSGGHSNGGYSSCNDCIVINLRAIRTLEIEEVPFDDGDATATVGVGNKLNELAVYLELDASQIGKKYWIPCGYQNIGIGGHIHGGGWGAGVRKYGLTTDSVVSARMLVIKEQGGKLKAKFVTASATKNSDLLLCSRGVMGPGCGIVLTYTIKVYEQVPVFTWSNVVSIANPGLALPYGTYETNIDVGALINSSLSEQRARADFSTHIVAAGGAVRISDYDFYYYDSEFSPELTGDDLAEAILTETDDYMDFFQDLVTASGGIVVSSTTFNGTYLQIRCRRKTGTSDEECRDETFLRSFATDPGFLAQRGVLYNSLEEYNGFLDEWGDVWYDSMLDCAATNPTFACGIVVAAWGGKIGDIDVTETGFSYRDTKFDAYRIIRWRDDSQTDVALGLLNDVFFQIWNVSEGTVFGQDARGYVNYVIDPLRDEDEYLPFYYGSQDNIDRLTAAKCNWDPNGFFDNPQGLPFDSC